MTIAPLEYRPGHSMRVGPINQTMDVTVFMLQNEQPTVVHLEPGDGTHYALLIVPTNIISINNAWGRYGIRPANTIDWLLVTKLADRDMRSAWLPLDCDIETHHTQYLAKNEWTQIFLAWWLNNLREALATEGSDDESTCQ